MELAKDLHELDEYKQAEIDLGLFSIRLELFNLKRRDIKNWKKRLVNEPENPKIEVEQ